MAGGGNQLTQNQLQIAMNRNREENKIVPDHLYFINRDDANDIVYVNDSGGLIDRQGNVLNPDRYTGQKITNSLFLPHLDLLRRGGNQRLYRRGIRNYYNNMF